MEIPQLIIACKKQDKKAQRELYEMYAPIMMAVCVRYCPNREVARDILHDGFVQVFMQISSFRSEGSFEGWLKRIFVNLALQHYRKEKLRSDLIENMLPSDENISLPNEFDKYDDVDVTEEKLLSLIRELPDGYRAIFNLFVFENLSHREISRTLGISEAASRSQYARARALLQKKLHPFFRHTCWNKK